MGVVIRLPEMDKDAMKQLGKNIKESPGSSALALIIFAMTSMNVEADPALKAEVAGFISTNTDALAWLIAAAWHNGYGFLAAGALWFARFTKGDDDPAAIEEKVEAEVQRRLAANPTQAKEQV